MGILKKIFSNRRLVIGAVEANDIETLKELVNRRANVNVKDSCGKSP